MIIATTIKNSKKLSMQTLYKPTINFVFRYCLKLDCYKVRAVKHAFGWKITKKLLHLIISP